MNDINTRDFETGVNESEGPVLPDRLQNNYLKGPDHPTPFAKGTEVNDNTDGGLKLSHKAETETHTNEAYSEEDMYCKPPPGWSAERVDEEDEKEEEQIEPVIHRRQLEGDSHLDFIPYETFSGNKPGYIFRLGSKGIGYYQDQISK